MSTKKLKAGLIGCGNIGSLYDEGLIQRESVIDHSPITHASALIKSPNTELVAICDSNANRLKTCGVARSIENQYADFAEMLSKEKIDLLCIATHPAPYSEILKLAGKAGIRRILLEKPAADTAQGIEELARISKEFKQLVAVNYLRNWYPATVSLKSEIESRTLGQPIHVHINYDKGLLNNGTHALALIQYLIGLDQFQSTDAASDPEHAYGSDRTWSFRAQISHKGSIAKITSCAFDYRKFSIFELDFVFEFARVRFTEFGTKIRIDNIRPDHEHTEYKVFTPRSRIIDAHSTAFTNAIHNISTAQGESELNFSIQDSIPLLKSVELIQNSENRNGLNL